MSETANVSTNGGTATHHDDHLTAMSRDATDRACGRTDQERRSDRSEAATNLIA